jgi:hypothetical protein
VSCLSVSALAQAGDPRPKETGAHHGDSRPSNGQTTPPPASVTVINTPAFGLNPSASDAKGGHYYPDKPFWLQWEFWTAVGTLLLAAGTVSLVVKTDGLIKSAEQTAHRQLRAYVFADNATLLDGRLAVPVVVELIDKVGAFIIIKNFGQTPAYKTAHWGDFKIMEIRDENSALRIPLPFPNANRNDVPPSGTANKTHRRIDVITDMEIEGIKKGTYGIYVYGRIEYIDAFDKSRFTNYRLRYTGAWPPNQSAIFMFCENGNESD